MDEQDLLEGPWAQLVSIQREGDEEGEEVVPIVGNKLSIGRKEDAVDYVVDNQHVSGCHCILSRRDAEGKVSLKDTSTNGTLLNGKRLKRNVNVELMHNDIITIVQKKENRQKIAYRYEDLRQKDESDATVTYDPEDTLEVSQNEGGEEETGEGEELLDVEKDQVLMEHGRKKRKLEKDNSEKVSAAIDPASHVILPSASTLPSTTEQDASSDPPKPAVVKKDSIEETLICQICQEILHDCVSLQPCMHSYCAGCYSEWMAHSRNCPACRNKVERISKNHIVNNLVAAYLRANPEKKRPGEDLQELDSKNKISHDMLYPKKEHDYSDEDYDTDSSSSSSDDPILTFTPAPFGSYLPSSLCRQCPGYVSPPSHPPHPSPSHPYSCSMATQHVLCQCCLRPMPNRADPTIIQKCELCDKFYCHQYWTCLKPGCSGCLAPFKELNLSSTCLNGILGNAYESDILKNYLEGKGLSIKDFLQACCAKLESNDYHCSDPRLTTSTNVCHVCAGKSLKELAYLYRRDIASGDLPLEVTRRIDCYWGKECRTQFKPHHAMKFNHICEKTRHT